jgi:imidazolonepropionase-like amidohydrolase
MTALTRTGLWPLLMALFAANPLLAQDPPKDQDKPKVEAEVAEAVEEEAVEEPEAKPEAVVESPYLAVVGGDVHTVTRGLIPGGTVLCKQGRILKIGQGIRIPEGARVVDAHGMQVYPGLVAVNSRGLLRGNGADARDSFDPFSLYVDLGLAGGLTTVHSSGAVAKLTRGTLEGHMVDTTSWVTLSYSSTSPSGRRKLRVGMDQAREYLRQVRSAALAKKMGEEDVKDPEQKGVPMDYVGLLKGERMAKFTANSAKDLLSVCEFLEEYPMQAVIFGGQEAWTLAPRLGRTGAYLVLTPRQKRWADDKLNRDSGWSIENAQILWNSGVEFALIPSQTSISLSGLAGRDLLNLPMEAAFAIRGGLSQDAALRAITLDAARILGVADRLGSLEVGKDADMIICNGDLFDYRTFVEWAVVNGHKVYDKQRASYFAHIRPRAEPTAEEIVEEVIEVLDDVEIEEVGEPDGNL